jgi:hypothetical protein
MAKSTSMKNRASAKPGVGAGRGRAGWLSTPARTDLAHVTVYALHVLKTRVQTVIRRSKQGHPPTLDELEGVRQSMLDLWHDAHRRTPPGAPLSNEQYQEQMERSR